MCKQKFCTDSKDDEISSKEHKTNRSLCSYLNNFISGHLWIYNYGDLSDTMKKVTAFTSFLKNGTRQLSVENRSSLAKKLSLAAVVLTLPIVGFTMASNLIQIPLDFLTIYLVGNVLWKRYTQNPQPKPQIRKIINSDIKLMTEQSIERPAITPRDGESSTDVNVALLYQGEMKLEQNNVPNVRASKSESHADQSSYFKDRESDELEVLDEDENSDLQFDEMILADATNIDIQNLHEEAHELSSEIDDAGVISAEANHNNADDYLTSENGISSQEFNNTVDTNNVEASLNEELQRELANEKYWLEKERLDEAYWLQIDIFDELLEDYLEWLDEQYGEYLATLEELANAELEALSSYDAMDIQAAQDELSNYYRDSEDLAYGLFVYDKSSNEVEVAQLEEIEEKSSSYSHASEQLWDKNPVQNAINDEVWANAKLKRLNAAGLSDNQVNADAEQSDNSYQRLAAAAA